MFVKLVLLKSPFLLLPLKVLELCASHSLLLSFKTEKEGPSSNVGGALGRRIYGGEINAEKE